MPRLNRTGRIAQGNGLCWLDDTRQIRQLQQPDGSWKICIDGKPVSDLGCNKIAASAGFWLAYIPGYGVFGASGLLLEGAGFPSGVDGRGAASFDGTIAIADNTENIGLTLLTANGEVTAHVPGASLTDKLCVVSKTQALWIDQHGEVQTVGLPKPQMLPGQKLWPKVLILNGERWICYHSDDAIGVVLHPFDSLIGYQITLPPAFYLDAVALSEQLVRIVWALDSAEGRIDDEDINIVTDQRVRLGSAPQPPTPTKPPPPKPEPEPPPVSIPNHLSDVQRVRANYPTPLGIRHGAFLIDVAKACGAKLLRKEAGTHVVLPNGIGVSQDILMIDGQGFDILSDGEGAAIPAWQEKGPIPGEYIDVSGMGTPEPQPVPNPGTPAPNPGTPPVPSVDLSAIVARLEAIERRIDAGNADTRAGVLALAAAIETLRTRPVPVPSVVFPDYTNRIIGTMRPVK